jgi:hypothetical protein
VLVRTGALAVQVARTGAVHAYAYAPPSEPEQNPQNQPIVILPLDPSDPACRTWRMNLSASLVFLP